MAEQFSALTADHAVFIEAQHLFFVGTAAADGRVNVSPKGTDSLRVLGPNQVVWLNLTGSGNETAAHLLRIDRMTLMFCSFDRQPLILRLYGRARAVHPQDAEWTELAGLFGAPIGSRQCFVLDIELVQTSCGFAVPVYSYEGERRTLSQWAEKRGEAGIRAYWQEKNRFSIDGFATGIGLAEGPRE
jgi:hypothetical protein